jgi:hypothetical protein
VNFDFSVSDFENFWITAIASKSSRQSIYSIRIVTVGYTSMNQLASKIYVSLPISADDERKN